MSKKSIVFFAILVTIILACSSPQNLNILIITGGHGFEHDQFFEMFDSFENITYSEAVHPKANLNYSPEKSSDIDVFVFYDMNQDISEQEKANFLQMVKNGKGLLFMHHSLANYQNWDDFLDIIGGRYLLDTMEVAGQERPASTYEHDVDINIQVVADHPVTKGLKDFTIHDEIYGGYYVSSKVTPLLKTVHPKSTETIAWANQYGTSRIVTIQLGHDHFAYENENFKLLLSNAINWVAD